MSIGEDNYDEFKKSVIVMVIIVIILFLLCGYMFGFPWQRIIAATDAKKYVEEKYQLTPIKTTTSMLFNYPETVTIYTKELDFEFDVINGCSDDLLEKKSEYYLAKELDEYIKEKSNDQGLAFVSLLIARINDFGLEDIDYNPRIVFDKLQNYYWCGIKLYDDIDTKDYGIDYDFVYDIYNKVFEFGLIPDRICFTYFNKKGNGKNILTVIIDKKHFSDINSCNDLSVFFDDAIKGKR